MKRPVAVRGVAISPVSTKIGVEPKMLIDAGHIRIEFLSQRLERAQRKHRLECGNVQISNSQYPICPAIIE